MGNNTTLGRHAGEGTGSKRQSKPRHVDSLKLAQVGLEISVSLSLVMIPCLSFLNARVPEMSHPILGLRTNSGRQALTPFEDSTSKTLHCASAVSLPRCGPTFQHLTFWGTPCMYSTLCSPVQPTGYADFTTEVPQPAWQFMQHFMQKQISLL